MSVLKHRVAAGVVLTTGVAILMGYGWALGRETDAIRGIRDQLDGTWIATTIAASDRTRAEGESASPTTIRFDGRSVAIRNRIEGGDAAGTFLIDPATVPPRFDLMLDKGWTIGTYRLEGETLRICVNPLMLPEQLGVPTRGRPTEVGPGFGRLYYEFRKSTP